MLLFLYLSQLYVLRSLYSSEEKFKNCSKRQTQKSTQLMQICRLKRWCLLLLCSLSVLCVRISSLQAQEDELKKWEAQCVEYFTEIMEIQKFREMLRIGSEEMIKRYQRGNLTKEELDSTLAVWHTTESELRQKVTKIYDTAYAEKCFEDESKRTERRDAP